ERISLESVITTAIELKVEAARRHRVTVVPDYRPPLGHVRADRARVRHLLAAIIDRVVHAMPAGRTLTISARRKQRSVLLAIGDRDQDPATHEDVSARELQFVLANEVLVLHGGVLHMSRPVGGGTPTVWIQLPLSRRRTKS
ncbi:MAG TPA: ATP-binding protein, partial [Kofleriaceae bacterium]|nr:ATP-binding protein [Kofleriaceae bacterium]